MKKLLIIGASILQLPAIQKAKKLGLYVGVIDYNPHAVGIEAADEYFNISTIDEEGVYQAAKKFHADGIMTVATDMPMRAVAYACKKLGLTGISYDTAVKSTDKGEMIRAFQKHHVAHPWYVIIKNDRDLENAKANITYPCICKPTDNAGSRGVILINDEPQLNQAVRYSAENGRSGSVIIEEFLQGQEVSVEIMVANHCIHVLQVTDKITTGAPHFVEMGHSQPSQLAEDAVDRIKNLAMRAVKAVGIDNGPAHVEMMLTRDGPKMIELGARMGGDCITTHLVPLSTGVDMVKAAIQIALGQEPDLEPKHQKGAAIRYLETPCGTVKAAEGVDRAEAMEGIKEVAITKSIGDCAGEIGSSSDRAGFVIAQGDTAARAMQLCEEAAKQIIVVE